jgi:hypothetical protein
MDSTALGKLRSKFLKEVRDLEDQLKERRDKIKAIDLVLGILIEEGEDKTPSQSISGEAANIFRKMGPTEAIEKCLTEPVRWWSVTEIKKKLIDGGFKTKSKHLSNIITSTLKRLKNIEVDTTVKPQRFKIKEATIDDLLKENKSTT